MKKLFITLIMIFNFSFCGIYKDQILTDHINFMSDRVNKALINSVIKILKTHNFDINEMYNLLTYFAYLFYVDEDITALNLYREELNKLRNDNNKEMLDNIIKFIDDHLKVIV